MHTDDQARFLEQLGREVRERRRLQGLTQSELAERAGLSTRYVAQVEAGLGNLSILRLLDLTKALGVPLHEALCSEKRQPIVALIGLRGAGKSTVGRELAMRLEWPFVELDEQIEGAVGLSLAEIFAIHGESYYRRVEREVLERFVSESGPTVLATGGSLVTDRATLNLLKKNALTVWLRASPELHLQRVSAQGDRRPMAGRADPLSELKSLLRQREPLYAEADITIDTTDRPASVVVDQVLRRIRKRQSLR